nr:hypothetical protein [Tanacetum cinerariifolium]
MNESHPKEIKMTRMKKSKENASSVEIQIISSENAQNYQETIIKEPTAYVGGSWSDSDKEGEENTKDEKCIMAKASNEISPSKLVHLKLLKKTRCRKRVGDEEVVVREGVVVTSSSLEMLTNRCLEGIMVSLIFLEGLEEEALVEFMVELFEEDEDGKKNEKDGLFSLRAKDQSRKA